MRTSALILAFGSGALLLSFDPSVLEQFQASISVLEEEPLRPEAFLLSPGKGLADENTEKLQEIMANLFPNLSLKKTILDDEEGKKLYDTFQPSELPTVYMSRDGLGLIPLSSMVKNLFDEGKNSFFVLRAHLINPSGQVLYRTPWEHLPTGIQKGNPDALFEIVLFSDVGCQACRVLERTIEKPLQGLIDEGFVRLKIFETPQSFEDTALASLVTCYESSPEFRKKLLDRANLTLEYAQLEKARMGLHASCEESEISGRLEKRAAILKEAGGIYPPVLFIGKTGGSQWIRFSGAQPWEMIESTLSKLVDNY